MKNTNKNKNKYSIIFALCSMLSYGVYGAASSSDLRGSSMSSEGPQNISEQQNRKKEFYCYTRKDIENFARNRNDTIYTIYFPIRSYEKLEGEIQISNISGTVISSKKPNKNGSYDIETDDGKFKLPINDVSLCCYRENTGEINNILIVKLFIDPNDPTKAIFIKLASSQDRGTMESILQENKFEFNYNSILRLCNQMAQIEDREKIIEEKRKELKEQKSLVESIAKKIIEEKRNIDEAIEIVKSVKSTAEMRKLLEKIRIAGIEIRKARLDKIEAEKKEEAKTEELSDLYRLCGYSFCLEKKIYSSTLNRYYDFNNDFEKPKKQLETPEEIKLRELRNQVEYLIKQARDKLIKIGIIELKEKITEGHEAEYEEIRNLLSEGERKEEELKNIRS